MLAMNEIAPEIVPNVCPRGKRWHVVRSVTGADKAIRESLKRIGFELYWPMRRVMRPIPRKLLPPKQRKHAASLMRPRDEPLFGPYMFVLFDLADGKWHDVFGIVGIHGMIISGGLPVPMPDGFVEALRAQEIDGAIPGETPLATLEYSVGDTVRLVDGSFQGLKGTIADLDVNGAVGLLLEMMGQKVRVTDLTVADIEKV